MSAARHGILTSRLLWRSFAASGLLILLTLALLGESVIRGMRDGAEDDALGSMHTSLQLVAPQASDWIDPLDDSRVDSFPPEIVATARQAGLRLTLFSAAGVALLDTAKAPSTVPSLAEDPLWKRTLASSAGVVRGLRPPALDQPETLVCAVRLGPVDLPLGVLRATQPTAAIEARLDAMRSLVLIALLACLTGAFGLAFVRTRNVERPAREMTEVARAMTEGDFGQRLPVRDGDSLGELAAALNGLGSASRGRMLDIETDRNRVLAILGVMVEGVVAVDAEERVVHMNSAAARILDTQAAAAEGRRIWEVTRVREVSEILAAAIEGGESLRSSVRVVIPPRDRWVDLHASPLVAGQRDDGLERIAGAVVVLHDTSDLRRLEAIRKDFVANVSHELKTPITAIRGMVETVLDDPEMDTAFRDRFLARIAEQGQRLATLVTDLLTLSRLEADSQIAELDLLDLRIPIQESVQMLRQPAEQAGVDLEMDLPDRPVQVLGDAESLRLIVSNLVDNARKYTPAGGHVTVRLSVGKADALLEVTDTGIGIERKHLDRIFQRFYRVDKARSRELGGTGLGLSIVKHVCQAHRGDVGVESEPGHGSVFRVRLPLG